MNVCDASHRPLSRARVAALAAFVVASCLAGCGILGKTVPERFHTLLPEAGAAAAAPAPAPVHIDVLPVAVPAQVDHAQWVVRQPDGSLLMLEQDRWAASLPDELRGALVDGLAARWGGVDVRSVGAPATAVWRVRVDVQRFESVPGREARLEAAWSVSLPPSSAVREGRSLVCRDAFAEPVGQPSVDALAAGHRRNVARLVDAIGQRLQGMAAGGSAGCRGGGPPGQP